MSYRSYAPWNKSGLSSSYTSGTGSSSYTGSGSKSSDGSNSTSTSQYDSGYSRSRYGSGTSSGTSSSGTTRASSNPTPTYRSTYSTSTGGGISTGRDRSSSRDNSNKLNSSSTSSYLTKDSKESNRLSLIDKYSTGTYPGRSSESSSRYSSLDRKDPEAGSYSNKTISRRSSVGNRDASPEPSTDARSDRYSSTLSPYRSYGRSSYSRSNSKEESTSSLSSTPATTPTHVPSSLRFTSGNRYGSNIVRSPVTEKPPTSFGVSGLGYNRYTKPISRSSSQQDGEDSTNKQDVSVRSDANSESDKKTENEDSNENEDSSEVIQKTFVTIVTRGTSPTPPSTSSFLRARRADQVRAIEKTIARPTEKPEMVDKEIQSDRGDDTARHSRFGSRLASSPWSTYLDRYGGSNYTSRYSSRYGNYTTPSKSNSSPSTEPENSGRAASRVESSQSENIPAKVNQNTVEKDIAGKIKNTNTENSLKPKSETIDSNSTAVGSNKTKDKETENKSCSPSNRVSSSPANDVAVKPSDKTMKDKDIIATNTTNISSDKISQNTASDPLKKSSEKTEKQGIPSNNKSTVSLSNIDSVKNLQESAEKKVSLPPPVPKSDSHSNNSGLKNSSSLHSLNKLGTPNKDFRKSALNVNLTDNLQTEAFKKMQEQQRKASKKVKKLERSTSTSSGDSEISSSKDCSVKSLPATSKNTGTNVLRPSASLSKLNANKPTAESVSPSQNKLQSPAKTKSKESIISTRKSNSPIKSVPVSSNKMISHSSSESSSDDSSSESTSSSSSSSSDSESEENSESEKRNASETFRKQSIKSDKRSPNVSTTSLSRNILLSASSADESSISMDKPPRPPSSPKAAHKEEAKSFLMRALAPVTNLFRSKTQDTMDNSSCENLSEAITRTESSLSINKSAMSDKDESLKSEENQHSTKKSKNKSDKTPNGIMKIKSNKSIKNAVDSDKESSVSEKGRKTKFKIRRQESGERPWWLESNPNIPEGIQRIMSQTSIKSLINEKETKKSDDSDSSKEKLKSGKIRREVSGELPWWLDSNKEVPEGIQRINSSDSLSKIQNSNKEEEIMKYKIRHQQSGEKAWWLKSNPDIPEGILKLNSNKSLSNMLKKEIEDKVKKQGSRKTSSSEDESSEEESSEEDSKLLDNSNSNNRNVCTKSDQNFPVSLVECIKNNQDSAKISGRISPYDNVNPSNEFNKTKNSKPKRPKDLPLFIGNHRNIDDILGSAATLVDPVMGLSRLRSKQNLKSELQDDDDEEDLLYYEETPTQVRKEEAPTKTKQACHGDKKKKNPSGMIKLDDTALQLYKDGDYGSYLDLEASINEQQEEFDGFESNRKNSIVLRTQLSVRVHAIIEKLLNSEGRELRRALFSLKQIFQEDKDLVHEFVQNDGLACLIKVGSEADQNYQNYILRALGQVMLYVDGMNGVMEHNQTVQWLYSLIASKFRLVVKTALKLLLVFVEYVETNCLLLIKAVHAVDAAHGQLSWNHIMRLLKDYDASDTELLIYAMTLVNKTLNGIPDQDTYYDQVDALEEQGMEGTIQRYMSKQGTDLDLLRQFQIYEAVLHHEDGEEKGTPLKQLDETIRKTLRNRKCLADTTERRKSRRHSTGTAPLTSSLSDQTRLSRVPSLGDDGGSDSSSSRSSTGPGDSLGTQLNGIHKDSKVDDVGVTPALRRRRERAERQRSFIKEQQENAATIKATLNLPENGTEGENQRLCQRIANGTYENGYSNKLNRVSSKKDLTPLLNAVNKMDSENESKSQDNNSILKKPWVLSMMYGKNNDDNDVGEGDVFTENEGDETLERKKLLQIKRENMVKDLTQKLTNQNSLSSPVEESNNKNINRMGDMTGLISKAMEGLAKSKSKGDVLKSPTTESIPKFEIKKSETELHWDELVSSMKRPLTLCDLDFTDLGSSDEIDVLSPTHIANGGPPPPPPVPVVRPGITPPPPPITSRGTAPPPPVLNGPTLFGVNLKTHRNSSLESEMSNKNTNTPSKKTKKTVKLFWKEVRDDPIILAKLQKTGMIWDELKPVSVDTQKLEHLFESRAKDLISKKQQELNKSKEIIVLDPKRSNAINIGMTKLPPPRSIKTAILKMDATIMNREGIEKLLTMLPTEEERSKIQEAQMANPDVPLGSAEQFLLTLASISELPARLKLWAFKLDFENSEKEIAEPLMDLKQGMETLKANKTFHAILSTLLSIGIFLNGSEVKGFQIEYLAKVPEVKDTVHKHTLLHHLCHMVMEKFPESSDLYSEIGAVTRASKVDFEELSANIIRMEQECKASWDHLKVIAKHDGSTMMKVKMSDFLADCAERIIVLSIVHRRIMNRFHRFMLWLGIPMHRVQDMKPNELCRIVSEFALEYRTTRERVLQQIEKKANHRERNKTRGKMITEVGKFKTKEDRADAELRQLLGSDISDAESIHGTLPWRRQRKDIGRNVLTPIGKNEVINGHITDGDDEILESLVKTATKAPATRTTPRERKRTRNADRKSLRRTLKNGLSEEEKKYLAAYIKGY